MADFHSPDSTNAPSQILKFRGYRIPNSIFGFFWNIFPAPMSIATPIEGHCVHLL